MDSAPKDLHGGRSKQPFVLAVHGLHVAATTYQCTNAHDTINNTARLRDGRTTSPSPRIQHVPHMSLNHCHGNATTTKATSSSLSWNITSRWLGRCHTLMAMTHVSCGASHCYAQVLGIIGASRGDGQDTWQRDCRVLKEKVAEEDAAAEGKYTGDWVKT